eukprot:9423542-Pyramimonas_sp.AAC.1
MEYFEESYTMNADLRRHDAPLSFNRLLAEALFARNAFTFYGGLSPSNVMLVDDRPCCPSWKGPTLRLPKRPVRHESG